MTSTLIDSNILIDLLEDGAERETWSTRRMREVGDFGQAVINPVIAAEISIGFDTVPELERFLSMTDLAREPLPWAAAFQAGKAHALYRRRGGGRDRTLPDFLIGAHANLKGYRLLTRDPHRYRKYFPSLDIIAPDTHP